MNNNHQSAVIQMYHVSKSYDRDNKILSDINLEIHHGEFIFLTGASGAGKTTFIKLILREEHATKGQIVVLGRNLNRQGDSTLHLLRRNIGVVFQDFKLLKDRTVFDNIDFVLRVVGIPPKIRKKRVFSSLKMVGLEKKLWSYPQKLSGGEQQRLAIARAVVNNPLLILADEPTGNLDPHMAEEIMGLFDKINTMGTTVMIATHQLALIEQMGRKYITLRAGKIWNN
ncbi:MAG: cell division ATP-binding protein FtsE [bacterium]